MAKCSKIIKKFLLPFIFLIFAIYMIPKESYLKKENFIIEVKGENISGQLQLSEILGYRIEKNDYKLKENTPINFPNTIRDNYNILLSGEVNKVEIKSETGKKLELKNISSLYKKKELNHLYSKSIVNIIVFILIIGIGSTLLLKERIYLTFKNLLATSIGLIFLSISFNTSFLSKANAIFFIIFIFFIALRYKRVKIDLLCITCAFLLLFSLTSEYFNLGNYRLAYESFEKSFMILIIIKMINFKRKHIEILKKYLYISLIMAGVINILSPLVMAGVYCFQFGILMMILLCLCFEVQLNIKLKNNIVFYLFSVLTFIISIYGIIYSGRRTVLLIVILYLIYKILNLKNKNSIKIFILILSVLISFNIFFKKESNQLQNQALSIINIREQSNSQRLLMWKKSFFVLKENFYKGIGIGNFYNEISKDKYKSKREEEKEVEKLFQSNYVHPHSEYWNQILMRGGLAGLLYLFIMYNLYRGLKLKKKDPFYIVICCIFTVFGIFEPYSLRGESYIFWIFMGLELPPMIINKNKQKIMNYIGWILVILIFISSLYFSKRFRYYSIIAGFLGLIYFLKIKRSKNEKI